MDNLLRHPLTILVLAIITDAVVELLMVGILGTSEEALLRGSIIGKCCGILVLVLPWIIARVTK